MLLFYFYVKSLAGSFYHQVNYFWQNYLKFFSYDLMEELYDSNEIYRQE